MKKFIDFELSNTEGVTISLKEEIRSNNVLLLFYRGTFWGVWVKQLMQVRQLEEEIKKTNTKILAISVDDNERLLAMKKKTRVSFDFLSDPDLEITKRYGLVDDQLVTSDYIDNMPVRTGTPREVALSATIIINKEGFIEYLWSGGYSNRPNTEDVLKILRKIKQ